MKLKNKRIVFFAAIILAIAVIISLTALALASPEEDRGKENDANTADKSNGNAITVIQKNELAEIRESVNSKEILSLSYRDIQGIIASAVEMYEEYDEFVLLGYGDIETEVIKKETKGLTEIGAHDEDQRNIYRIIVYIIEAKSSHNVILYEDKITGSPKEMWNTVFGGYTKYYLLDCESKEEIEAFGEALWDKYYGGGEKAAKFSYIDYNEITSDIFHNDKSNERERIFPTKAMDEMRKEIHERDK